jgi:hypothetical protein
VGINAFAGVDQPESAVGSLLRILYPVPNLYRRVLYVLHNLSDNNESTAITYFSGKI